MHDVRHPIGAAQMIAKTMLHHEAAGLSPDEQRLLMRDLGGQLQRALDLLEDTLSLMRGNMHLDRVRVDAEGLGAEIELWLAPLRSSKAALTVDIAPGFEAQLDLRRIGRAVANLLLNAVDASRDVPPPARRLLRALFSRGGGPARDGHGFIQRPWRAFS